MDIDGYFYEQKSDEWYKLVEGLITEDEYNNRIAEIEIEEENYYSYDEY